ncbi:MAG: hypothetical protein DRJ47_01665 [Thermoprotei archaeon]|nr:MAG: hypothetical protein DRJ47_01665 [Thermoprotei archaeon]
MNSFLVWKVAWSSCGYRGWDPTEYKKWLSSRSSSFGYVKNYGFGHEWWNFFEGFSDEYYYGYAPPLHAMKPSRFRKGVIFFISRKPGYKGGWFLIGVYGRAELLQEPFDPGYSLWDTIPPEYRGEIREVTRKELIGGSASTYSPPSLFLLRARKEYSTPMPAPMPLSLHFDVGVKGLGNAFFTYIEEDKAIHLLEKAVGFIENLVRARSTSSWVDPHVAAKKLRRLLNEIVREVPQKRGISPSFCPSIGGLPNMPGRGKVEVKELLKAHRLFELKYGNKLYNTALSVCRRGEIEEKSIAILSFLLHYNGVWYTQSEKGRKAFSDLEKHFSDIYELLSSVHPIIRELKDKTLLNVDLEDPVVTNSIVTLYNRFSGVLDATGASKALHLLHPKLFIMWDDSIRKSYGIHIPDGDNYLEFLRTTKRELSRVVEDYANKRGLSMKEAEEYIVRNTGVELTKLLDEYNYLKYTRRELRE